MSPFILYSISLLLLAAIVYIQQKQIRELEDNAEFLNGRIETEAEYAYSNIAEMWTKIDRGNRPAEYRLGWLNDPELHLKVEREEEDDG